MTDCGDYLFKSTRDETTITTLREVNRLRRTTSQKSLEFLNETVVVFTYKGSDSVFLL